MMKGRLWVLLPAVVLVGMVTVQLSGEARFGGGVSHGSEASREGGKVGAGGSGDRWTALLQEAGFQQGATPDQIMFNERVGSGPTQQLVPLPQGSMQPSSVGGGAGSIKLAMSCGDVPCESASLGGDVGDKIKGALGDVIRQLAGNVVDSYLQPQPATPLEWRVDRNQDGSEAVYDSTRTVTVPQAMPLAGMVAGKTVPVQLNTRIVFPKPTETKVRQCHS